MYWFDISQLETLLQKMGQLYFPSCIAVLTIMFAIEFVHPIYAGLALKRVALEMIRAIYFNTLFLACCFALFIVQELIGMKLGYLLYAKGVLLPGPLRLDSAAVIGLVCGPITWLIIARVFFFLRRFMRLSYSATSSSSAQ